MSLTEHQLDLLISNDYNVGKFYIALNTKDDNNINWFEYYDEQLQACKKSVAELKEELRVWEADNFDREDIVRKANAEADAIIEKSIEAEKKIVRGLSKVIHEVTSMAADDKLDPQHISENNLMTELLEEISSRNDDIAALRQKQVGDIPNIDKEIILHGKRLIEDLEHYKAEIVSHKKNKTMMLERQQWLQDAFDISDTEKQEIITRYKS